MIVALSSVYLKKKEYIYIMYINKTNAMQQMSDWSIDIYI